MYRVTERVEDEYGPHDHNNITNILEPIGIISAIAIGLLVVSAFLSQ
jgi:hypothetical protein